MESIKSLPTPRPREDRLHHRQGEHAPNCRPMIVTIGTLIFGGCRNRILCGESPLARQTPCSPGFDFNRSDRERRAMSAMFGSPAPNAGSTRCHSPLPVKILHSCPENLPVEPLHRMEPACRMAPTRISIIASQKQGCSAPTRSPSGGSDQTGFRCVGRPTRRAPFQAVRYKHGDRREFQRCRQLGHNQLEGRR